MVLVIVGAIIALGSVVLMIKDEGQSVLFYITMFVGAIIILFGLFCPFEGFEEPVLVETKTLYPLISVSESEAFEQEEYLLVEIDNNYNQYTYCVEKNGFRSVEERNDIKVVVKNDIEKPILEKYEIRPKKTIFSFTIKCTNYMYVIQIPENLIRFEFQ